MSQLWPSPPPPPPPPPAPLAPPTRPEWTQPGRESLVSTSIWPHRLLHVESMTSYVRKEPNIYNNVEAPEYNVLSYTWGFYQDSEKQQPPLLVHGVEWPIPSIKKEHFTTATFHDAIKRAARGFNCPCQWLWVDIACIPQEFNSETEEAARLRGQEIGNQLGIFQRAKEAFAWLSSLKKTDIWDKNKLPVSVDNLLVHISNATEGVRNGDMLAAADFVSQLESDSCEFEAWMTRVLDHPWFRSLWTLQEMVLRADAWILFDDGLLKLDKDNEGTIVRPWNFNRVKTDIFALRSILSNDHTRNIIDEAEVLINRQSENGIGTKEGRDLMDRITLFWGPLLALQELKGLNALTVKFPHTAYSIAQNRRVTRLEDRIYGIIQTYGISCSSFPPGGDSKSRLHALEDEFGKKLVAKLPLLSQLFIHSSADEMPRRSWLITQKCKVDDPFWTLFTTDYRRTYNLFHSFKEYQEEDWDATQRVGISFIGQAWSIESFVAPSSPSSALPVFQKKLLFSAYNPTAQEKYRGLMLDHHISKTVLGRVVDYFSDHESMSQAVQRLNEHYTYDITYPSRTSVGIKIALLGSSSAHKLPVVEYVGIVLVPCFESTFPQNHEGIRASEDHLAEKTTTWKRIGLMRWTEVYSGLNQELHYNLSRPYDFRCVII